MTSTPVNVQGFVPGAMYGTNRVQGTENKGDFSKIFESQKNVTEQADDSKVVHKDTGVDDMNSQDDVEYKEEIKDTQKEVATENQTEATQKSTTVQESAESGKEQSATYKDMEEDGLTAEELLHVAELFGNAVTDVKEMLMQHLNLT